MMLHVEPNLTTVFSLLVMEMMVNKTTSLSRTHGVLHGEIADTSKSLTLVRMMLVSVVLTPNPHSPRWLNHDHLSDSILFNNFYS